MKNKLFVVLTAMLCTLLLVGCGGTKTSDTTVSESEGGDETVEQTADSNVNEGTSTLGSNNGFVEMAKEMYMQYHDDEEGFYELLNTIVNEIYDETGNFSDYAPEEWIAFSSYSFNAPTGVHGLMWGGIDIATSYSEMRNGRTLENYAKDLASSVSSFETSNEYDEYMEVISDPTDVVIKKINDFDVAHFTFETKEDESFRPYYYRECYILDDAKDDEFLVIVYKYENQKKINDNSSNPQQMNSDHSSQFLASVLSTQTIREGVEKCEIEICDYNGNSTGIAINAPLCTSSAIHAYEKNIPIENSDDYKVINGYTIESGHYLYFSNEDMWIEVYGNNEGKTLYDFVSEMNSSNGWSYELQEISINGLNGYLETVHCLDYDSNPWYNTIRYFFENNGIFISLEFGRVTDSFNPVYNSGFLTRNIQPIIDTVHIVER